MKKYFQVAKNTWEESLAYRTSFIFYRIREFLQLISIYFIWFFVTDQYKEFFGYTQHTMLTYILVSVFVNDVVFATRTTAIAGEINQGILTNYLIRPISYIKYHFARDFGDKAFNLIFSLGELSIFFLIFHPPFILQTDIAKLFIFVLGLILALILHFFISVLIAFIGFWSNEVWGPRFIFYQVVFFLSGSLFPLDILPKSLFYIFRFSPFTYLTYFPTKLYGGQLQAAEIIEGFVIMIMWIIFMQRIVQYFWRKGLLAYTAQGS